MTKIEILVVCGVIGILGLIAGVAVMGARERTRDTTRLAQVREIQQGLEQYFMDKSSYPVAAEPLALGQATTLCLAGEGFDCSIAPDDAYLVQVPTPPAAGLRGRVRCDDEKNVYCYVSNGEDYTLEFELERTNRYVGLAKGVNCATPSELVPGACPGE